MRCVSRLGVKLLKLSENFVDQDGPHAGEINLFNLPFVMNDDASLGVLGAAVGKESGFNEAAMGTLLSFASDERVTLASWGKVLQPYGTRNKLSNTSEGSGVKQNRSESFWSLVFELVNFWEVFRDDNDTISASDVYDRIFKGRMPDEHQYATVGFWGEGRFLHMRTAISCAVVRRRCPANG